MNLFNNLQIRLEQWLLVRGLIYGVHKLTATHIGRTVKDEINRQFSPGDAKAFQTALDQWLAGVLQELRS